MKRITILAMGLLLVGYAPALEHTRGILDLRAPSWGVADWIQLPEGQRTLDVSDFRGKVVYILAFQAWCPGYHSIGFPTFQKVMAQYEGADDVAFVAIQTTFEGFHVNDMEGARKMAERYGLTIPVGHSGSRRVPSGFMRRYRTGGTPWVVLLDREGVVRYNDFHIGPEQAAEWIDRLRGEGRPDGRG